MGPSIKASRPSNAAQQDGREARGQLEGGGSVDKLRAGQAARLSPALTHSVTLSESL